MKVRTLYLWVSPIMITALVLICLGQRRELRDLRSKLSQSRFATQQRALKIDEQADEVGRLRQQADAQAKGNLARPSDPPLEDTLDNWIENVHRLNRYLDKHPELRIPQMANLRNVDWLSVTENAGTSDAEYRYALSRLRSEARQRVAGDIASAIRQYAQASGHNPTDSHELQAYLPPDFDLSILDQLQANKTSGISKKFPGLVAVGGAEQYPFVDKSVDLWDGTLSYSAEGSGVRSSEAPGQDYVVQAIADFKKKNGVLPVSATQLAGYPGISKLDPVKLSAVFSAYSTEVNP